MLTALCVALPARAGLIIIGGEGAVVLGGLAAAALPYAVPLPGNALGSTLLCIAGMLVGAAWIAIAGALRQYRGVNETISSLLLAYTAIALFKQLVEGPLRDPKTLNKPSTRSLVEALQIGGIAGSDVHWGLVLGVVACIGLGLWLAFTPGGFALRVVGGNPRTAQLVGLPVSRLILLACALGGACAGLAGAVEVAAVHTNANASLIAGYGYAGILVAFIARQNPLRDRPGRDPVRRLRRCRQPAAAPARPARRVGAGAAGNRLRADPRQRIAARRRLGGAPREAHQRVAEIARATAVPVVKDAA